MCRIKFDGEESAPYKLVKPKGPEDGHPIQTAEEAYYEIMSILTKCTDREYCIIADILRSVKCSLDRYADL